MVVQVLSPPAVVADPSVVDEPVEAVVLVVLEPELATTSASEPHPTRVRRPAPARSLSTPRRSKARPRS